MKACRSCGRKVARNAGRCPGCGRNLRAGVQWVLFALAAAVALGFVLLDEGCQEAIREAQDEMAR